MIRTLLASFACCLAGWNVSSNSSFGDELETQIQTILKIEKEGAGHAAAVVAMGQLVQQPASALIPLLHGIDRANPLAENWLQGAFEAIADRALQDGAGLPKIELETFARERTHSPQSRLLAFDWLVKIDPSALDRLTPGMVDDPSPEFRRIGVKRLIGAVRQAGEAKDAATSKKLYLQAFGAALDSDQLKVIQDVLTGLGEKPNLRRQLGLLDEWWLIGPFDHRNGIGFDAVYPPETEINLQKKYEGTDHEVSWIKKASVQRRAVLDLNKLVGPYKGAVVYAYREFTAERAQPVEIRLGTPNGWKLWVNGDLAFAHEEYHQTMRMDQYRVRASFKRGENSILLKICQNEQSQDWAQRWQFQVRVCDPLGTAVLPVDADIPEPASESAK